jgi:hypothetical protein
MDTKFYNPVINLQLREGTLKGSTVLRFKFCSLLLAVGGGG